MTAANFKPFVPPEKSQKELSFRALFLGSLLGLVFAVGNTYLGLKIGMTISASIPAAVLSMAILRSLCRKVTILENNIVQTAASVGEGLAAGVIFTIPALFLLGSSISIFHTFILSMLGSILGILFMIPMRRYIIVREHGILPFPEGTACAEILKSGEKDQAQATFAFWGIFVGAFYKLCNSALFLWDEVVQFTIEKYNKASLSFDGTPSLLGVGYIVGPRIATVLLTGGALGWWVFIPLIKTFGLGNVEIYPATMPIHAMSSEEIWAHYIRYIGAGSVAVGGIITLFRLTPMIWRTIVESFRELGHLLPSKRARMHLPRTDQDIPLSYLLLGSLAIVLTLYFFPGFHFNLVSILLLVILGFFFSGVTSVTVGFVGSSASPVSGMTISTLLITCLVFVGLGWTERFYLVAAITVGAVANITIALASTTSQDLKTGFLLGATPKAQQIAEIVGLILPSAAIGIVLYLLHDVYSLGSAQMPAPQATLMYLIVKGVIEHQLPLILVIVGVVLGLCVHSLRVPVLPFSIGLYLPISLSTSIMIGGLAQLFVKHRVKNKKAFDQGVLLSSGLVAGDACMGVVVALLSALNLMPSTHCGWFPGPFSLLPFFLLTVWLILFSSRKLRRGR